jgi:hypothetical protein
MGKTEKFNETKFNEKKKSIWTIKYKKKSK